MKLWVEHVLIRGAIDLSDSVNRSTSVVRLQD